MFHLFVSQPGDFLQAVNWGNHRAHLTCFISQGLLSFHCLRSEVLKNIVLCILSFLVVSVGKINVVSVTTSWLEAKVKPIPF